MPGTRDSLDAALRAIGTASGSAGLWTATRNHYGPFIRSRVTPFQPWTYPRWNAQRWLRTLSRAWAYFATPARLAGWQTYAAAVPLANRLGDRRHVTGYAHWFRINYVRRHTGQAFINDAPAVHALGSTVPFDVAVSASATRSGIWLTWSAANPWPAEPGSLLYAYATDALSPTINSFKPPANLIGVQPGTAAPPIKWGLPYAAPAGKHVFVDIAAQNADGRLSYRQRSLVVVA
jgi:hypothetical protein